MHDLQVSKGQEEWQNVLFTLSVHLHQILNEMKMFLLSYIKSPQTSAAFYPN